MKNSRTFLILAVAVFFTAAAVIISICTGRYPLTMGSILKGDEMAVRVFLTLRLPRVIMSVVAGFAIGCAGWVYQTIFNNPLASPDIIGVSSGASAGAAFAILFLSGGAFAVTSSAFVGGIIAVILSLTLSAVCGRNQIASVVLSGIAVNAIAQAILMTLKLAADPEKQLASIEYWTMGSLSAVTASKIPAAVITALAASFLLIILHRQILILSAGTHEAKMLGVNVNLVRFTVLILATLAVTSAVSVTGLISFIGLLAPHCARLIMKHNRASSMVLGGIMGALIMTLADILARSITNTELPISIFTSLLGAPFMLYLIAKGEKKFGF